MPFYRLIFCLFVPTVASLCPAQTDSLVVPPSVLLTNANRYLLNGNTDSARILFNAVLPSKPFAGKARVGLVQVALAEEEWLEGAHLCDSLLNSNPEQETAAHYFAGICEREWGAETAGLIRMVAWGKSRDHFEAVLAKDSLYKDVLYQFARLMEYKDELQEAIELVYRQVLLRPDQVDAQVGLFHIYRHYLSATDPDEAVPWLLSQRNEYGRYFAAEGLRRTRHFAEAETTFIELLSRPSRIPAQARYLSLAHLYATMNNTARAQYCYWKAVDEITSWLGAALIFEDLKYIINDNELEQYRSLSSDRFKIAFFHRFWRVRDPMPAAAINYRLIEHLQRYVHAQELFEFYGIRGGFTNPDRTRLLKLPRAFYLNKEFNDMGLIYLRLGPPNKIERTMGNAATAWNPNDPLQMRQDDQEETLQDRYLSAEEKWFSRMENPNTYGPKAVDPHQSWVYYASGDEPQQILHFALHNTASVNWRLTPLPGDPDYLDKEMLAELAIYDTRYERLKKKGNELEFSGAVADLQLEEKKTVATVLNTDRHVWSNGTKGIALPHAIDAFRNPGGGTLLDVSYAIPYAPLREAAGANARNVLVEVGISIASRAGTRVIDSRLDTLDLLLTPDGEGSYIGLFRRVLVADSVRCIGHVRALQVPAVGTWTEQLRVPSFAGRDFMLSDMQLLLPATYGPVIEIDGVKVQQSPFQDYSRAKPVYAYLQVYNLMKDMRGSAGYTARITLAPRDQPEDATVLAEVKRDLTEDNTRAEFQVLDIQAFNPGLYTLTMSITDSKRVQTLVRSREIKITK
jgi:GWxTD domain-containing protein